MSTTRFSMNPINEGTQSCRAVRGDHQLQPLLYQVAHRRSRPVNIAFQFALYSPPSSQSALFPQLWSRQNFSKCSRLHTLVHEG